MMKVAVAAQMREMDRRAMEEYGVPGIVLMENAALRVVEATEKKFGPLRGKQIAVVCGKGNNGGDGLAIARHLAGRCGASVVVWTLAPAQEYRGDAATNYEMAQKFGLDIRRTHGLNLAHVDLIVDAIFGTGIRGAVSGAAADAIEKINAAGKPVIAVDIPSGVDGDTGQAQGPAVQATMTVTFALPKYGLLDYPGAKLAGEVIVADIGLPTQVVQSDDIQVWATEAADVRQWLPARVNGRDSNKGKFGHVLALAGSSGFVGAPVMVAEAAARAGAGLVTLAVPEGIHQAAMSRVSPVVMTQGAPQSPDGTFGPKAIEALESLLGKASAVALGPGVGKGDAAAEFVRAIVARCAAPMVVDADALNLLAQEPDHGASILRARPAPTILTPHPGEMGRLLGLKTEEVQADRRGAVTRAAETFGCIVLLKGARTLIAAPEGRLYVNTTSNAGMATGGSGDVLTGMISALLAQHLEPLQAAACGAYLHGMAGDMAAAEQGATGLIATDLIDHLPRAIFRCQEEPH